MPLQPITTLSNEELEMRCMLRPWERVLQSNGMVVVMLFASVAIAASVFVFFRERWMVGAITLALGVLFLLGSASLFLQARVSEWRRKPFVEELKRRAGQA